MLVVPVHLDYNPDDGDSDAQCQIRNHLEDYVNSVELSH